MSTPQAPRPRVVVHDYSGHPGQAQLSRALARRGYEVVHQHCPSYTSGKGSLERRSDDPSGLTFEAVTLRTGFKRYSVLERVVQEWSYGRLAAKAIVAAQPDVVILSNVPLLAHLVLAHRLRRRRISMIFWHQDIYSAAIGSTARKLFPHLGAPISWLADRMERHVARQSQAVVAISPTFVDKLTEWGVAWKSIVVPNWAPLDELPQRPKRNPWSTRQGLADVPVVLYSGTLGLKHDPSILATVAEELRRQCPAARLVVVSEGMGRQWLEDYQAEHPDNNLVLLDYQPYEEFPDVLASADVLLALLEPDASRFSVPSKVLSYMCAGRAIMAVMSPHNSVAQILDLHDAGLVADPADRADVAKYVVKLLNDDALRRDLAAAARWYAEDTFSPERAADSFEELMAAFVPSPALDQV